MHVADALFTHDYVVRSFVPLYVENYKPGSLVFAARLPTEERTAVQERDFLVGMFVLSQNGASDTGAALRHFAKGGTSYAHAVDATTILRHFDAYAASATVALSLEGFRLSCVAAKSRLGGAARLTEDKGASMGTLPGRGRFCRRNDVAVDAAAACFVNVAQILWCQQQGCGAVLF